MSEMDESEVGARGQMSQNAAPLQHTRAPMSPMRPHIAVVRVRMRWIRVRLQHIRVPKTERDALITRIRAQMSDNDGQIPKTHVQPRFSRK